MATIQEGKAAPAFTLADAQGKKVSLADFAGRNVIVYFYPRDDTPGCTKEACGFRDSITPIQKTGSMVLGVSLEGQESHRKFIAKHGLPFSLLSDEDAAVSKAYGVYVQKNMYGKKYWGIERSTFVFNPDGIMKAIFRKVKVDGHVDEVLTALKA